jgi:hypothetical protein
MLMLVLMWDTRQDVHKKNDIFSNNGHAREKTTEAQ